MASIENSVIIIGGGLGGLLLAQGLKKSGIPFHLYERDARADYRPQGYRIRISGPGIDGLKTNLSNDLWSQFELSCAETVLAGGASLNALTGEEQPSGMQGRPLPGATPQTADRTVLRRLLLKGIEDNVTFGAEFTHYEVEDGNDQVTACFKDGSTAIGHCLVGADGVHSQVRKQLKPHLRLIDTLGRCIYGKTHITEDFLAHFHAKALTGMTLVQDSSKDHCLSLLLEPIRFSNRGSYDGLPDDYIYWVLAGRKELFGIDDKELYQMAGKRAVSLSQAMTENWDASFRILLEKQDPVQASMLRISSTKPNEIQPSHSPLVTVIGDAAHAMSAAGGIGAVTAFRDAAALATALSSNVSWSIAIAMFEEEMVAYGKEAIELTARGGSKLFGQPTFEACSYIQD